MMYQFQRSFIKAASESVGVYGSHRGASLPWLPSPLPCCLPSSSWAVLPAEQGWVGAGRCWGVTEEQGVRAAPVAGTIAAVELHHEVWGALRGSLLLHTSGPCLLHCPGEGALLGAGDFLLAVVQPVDKGVGCQEGPVARGHGSAGLLQQLTLSTMDPGSLWSSRCSRLACTGHTERGNVPIFPSLESLWLQAALLTVLFAWCLLSAHCSICSACLWDGAAPWDVCQEQC